MTGCSSHLRKDPGGSRKLLPWTLDVEHLGVSLHLLNSTRTRGKKLGENLSISGEGARGEDTMWLANTFHHNKHACRSKTTKGHAPCRKNRRGGRTRVVRLTMNLRLSLTRPSFSVPQPRAKLPWRCTATSSSHRPTTRWGDLDSCTPTDAQNIPGAFDHTRSVWR